MNLQPLVRARKTTRHELTISARVSDSGELKSFLYTKFFDANGNLLAPAVADRAHPQ